MADEVAEAKAKGAAAFISLVRSKPALASLFKEKTGGELTEGKAGAIINYAVDASVPVLAMNGLGGLLNSKKNEEQENKDSQALFGRLVAVIDRKFQEKEGELGLKTKDVRLAVAQYAAMMAVQSKSPDWAPAPESVQELRSMAAEIVGRDIKDKADAMPAVTALYRKKTGKDFTKQDAVAAGGVLFDTMIDTKLIREAKKAGGGQKSYEMVIESSLGRVNALGLSADPTLNRAMAENFSEAIMRLSVNPNFTPTSAMMPATKAVTKELLIEKVTALFDAKENRQNLEMAEKANGGPLDRAAITEAIAESASELIADSRFRRQSPALQRDQFNAAITKAINDRKLIANANLTALVADMGAEGVTKALNSGAQVAPVQRELYMRVVDDLLPQIIDEKVSEAKRDALLSRLVVDYDDMKKPVRETVGGFVRSVDFFTLPTDKKKERVEDSLKLAFRQRHLWEKGSEGNHDFARAIAPEISPQVVAALEALPPAMTLDYHKQNEDIRRITEAPQDERRRFVDELSRLTALSGYHHREDYLVKKDTEYKQSHQAWEAYEKGARPEPVPAFSMIKSLADVPALAAKYNVDLRPFDMTSGSDAKEVAALSGAIRKLDWDDVTVTLRQNREFTGTKVKTGQAKLTGKAEDLDAAAKNMDALGIAFTRTSENGRDTILVDKSIVESYWAKVTPKNERLTAVGMLKKEEDERLKPFRERMDRQQKDAAEEQAYIAKLDKRIEALTAMMIRANAPGAPLQPPGAALGLPPEMQFSEYDVMLMGDPAKQSNAFKKAYVLFNVLAERQNKPPMLGMNAPVLPEPGQMNFYRMFGGNGAGDSRYASLMTPYARADATSALLSPGGGVYATAQPLQIVPGNQLGLGGMPYGGAPQTPQDARPTGPVRQGP